MKNDNFKWHGIVTASMILITFGFILGYFANNGIADKLIAPLIGLFAAGAAFLGVVYSKKEERNLKHEELEKKHQDEEENLLKKKKEEIIIQLYLTRESIMSILSNFISQNVKSEQDIEIMNSRYRQLIEEYKKQNSKFLALCKIYKISNKEELDNFEESSLKLLEPIAGQILELLKIDNLPYTIGKPTDNLFDKFTKNFELVEQTILD